MTEDEVLQEIMCRASNFGVSVLLSPRDYVVCDGLRVSGYFDGNDEQPTLAVAWGLQTRVGVLLHEYCHLTQWAENAPVWRQDEGAVWADWLNGKRVKDIKKKLAYSRELEADCERRTVRLIQELDAPVDLERYCRGANAYIHFYNTMAEVRRWYKPDRRPHLTPEVLELANPTLDLDYRKTPKPLREALLTCV